MLKLDRGTTLNTDGSRRVFPDPHGMSGSPVWWLPDETNALKLPALAGILTEYHKDLNALVATDIREAITQIEFIQSLG